MTKNTVTQAFEALAYAIDPEHDLVTYEDPVTAAFNERRVIRTIDPGRSWNYNRAAKQRQAMIANRCSECVNCSCPRCR